MSRSFDFNVPVEVGFLVKKSSVLANKKAAWQVVARKERRRSVFRRL